MSPIGFVCCFGFGVLDIGFGVILRYVGFVDVFAFGVVRCGLYVFLGGLAC